MKTLIKSLALALSLGVVTSSTIFAASNPGGRPKAVATYKTGIYMTQSGKLNIALDKDQKGSVIILLKSTNGSVLFTKHLTKKDQVYRTRLNLNDLEDGTYQVEITNGVHITSQIVSIATQRPTTPTRLISLN